MTVSIVRLLKCQVSCNKQVCFLGEESFTLVCWGFYMWAASVWKRWVVWMLLSLIVYALSSFIDCYINRARFLRSRWSIQITYKINTDTEVCILYSNRKFMRMSFRLRMSWCNVIIKMQGNMLYCRQWLSIYNESSKSYKLINMQITLCKVSNL